MSDIDAAAEQFRALCELNGIAVAPPTVAPQSNILREISDEPDHRPHRRRQMAAFLQAERAANWWFQNFGTMTGSTGSDFDRLLESGDRRLLESGDGRLLEGAP